MHVLLCWPLCFWLLVLRGPVAWRSPVSLTYFMPFAGYLMWFATKHKGKTLITVLALICVFARYPLQERLNLLCDAGFFPSLVLLAPGWWAIIYLLKPHGNAACCHDVARVWLFCIALEYCIHHSRVKDADGVEFVIFDLDADFFSTQSDLVYCRLLLLASMLCCIVSDLRFLFAITAMLIVGTYFVAPNDLVMHATASLLIGTAMMCASLASALDSSRPEPWEAIVVASRYSFIFVGVNVWSRPAASCTGAGSVMVGIASLTWIASSLLSVHAFRACSVYHTARSQEDVLI